MVQTWQSSDDPDMTCPGCLSVYAVRVTRYPASDRGQFVCEVCGYLMKEWNGTHDYTFSIKHRVPKPE